MLIHSSHQKETNLRSALAQRQELADLKFRRLLSELRDFEGSDVVAHAPSTRQVSQPMSPHTQVAASPTALPTLHVPLGAIAVLSHSEFLPAIGVNLGTSPLEVQTDLLTALLVEHNQEPFARILFLSPELSLLPLLGRYGFAFHRYVEDYEREIPYLVARYNLQQIRALEGGLVEWSNS